MASQRYLEILRQLLKESDGRIDKEALSELIRKARAKAGGKGKSEKAAAELGDFGEGHRIFIDVGDVHIDEWIQIVPGPGRWRHDRYGTVVITDETLQNFVDNFKNQVYQEYIPIDAEHQTKLSGALGYYKDMKVGHEDKPGVWAQIEFTDRGKELLDSGGFRYFSPEFYGNWTDPATGETYSDVITGGALTTRPFFKESSLEPVVASELQPVFEANEGASELVDIVCNMMYMGMSDEEINDAMEKAVEFARMMTTSMEKYESGMETIMSTEDENKEQEGDGEDVTKQTNDQDGGDSTANNSGGEVQASEQLQTYREENEQLRKQMSEYESVNKQLSDRVDAMEREARTKRFTEVVMGRGGENDGVAWFGETETHVNMLNKLADAFGEDSTEVKEYIELQNKQANALSNSKAFDEIGSAGESGSMQDADAIDAKVKALMEQDSTLNAPQALQRVLNENPQLYNEYNKAFNRRVKEQE